jgi:hypothetical protein
MPPLNKCELILSKMDGVEITPGIFLIGEPTPRSDLGDMSFACLANINGMLVVVELVAKLKGGVNEDK